jgi:hypothetical protein
VAYVGSAKPHLEESLQRAECIHAGDSGIWSCYWLTFNQAKQLGAHVRQGEKSTLVSFWKFNEYARENGKTGELENKTSVLLRYYRVFNVEQCDGLKALYGDDRKPVNPIAECESVADRMPNPPRIEQYSQAFCAWATRRDDRGVQPPEMIFNNR